MDPTTPASPPSASVDKLKLSPYGSNDYTLEHHKAAAVIQSGIRHSPRFSPDKKLNVTKSTVGMKPSNSSSTVGSGLGRHKRKHKKKKSKRGSPSYTSESLSSDYSDESSAYSESSSYSDSSSYRDFTSGSDSSD